MTENNVLALSKMFILTGLMQEILVNSDLDESHLGSMVKNLKDVIHTEIVGEMGYDRVMEGFVKSIFKEQLVIRWGPAGSLSEPGE